MPAPAVLTTPRPLRRTDFATASIAAEPVHSRPERREFRHSTRSGRWPVDPHPARPGELTDPTALCCAVAHAATEILRGVRPLAQLVRSVSPEVYDQLSARAQVRAASRTRPGAEATPQSRSRVRRARVVRVAPGVAEATVVIDDVDRVRAAALRVEEHRGRWRVVVLELG